MTRHQVMGKSSFEPLALAKVLVSQKLEVKYWWINCCLTPSSKYFIHIQNGHWGQILDTYLIRVRFMVFNSTFNNISVISWRSVLLVEETGVSGENRQPVTSYWQTFHIMLYRVHLVWPGFELTTLVVIGTDSIGSCKSNYLTITTTTDPCLVIRLKKKILKN